MKEGSGQDAVQFLLASERWEEAHALARTCMSADDVNSLYISTTQQQDGKAKYTEAERLYLTVGEPDLAIIMHEKLRRYDDMIRLVREYNPDILRPSSG